MAGRAVADFSRAGMPEELLKLEIEGITMKELMNWGRAGRYGPVGRGVTTSGHSEGYLAVRTLQTPQGSTCRGHRKYRILRLT